MVKLSQERFVGLGFQKCGSSSLYWLIREIRPDILGTVSGIEGKEAHGIDTWSPSRRKYERAVGPGLRLDFTPNYAYSIPRLVALREWYPQLRVLLTVRNPIDRFYSALDHGKSLGLFPEALSDDEAFAKSISPGASGHYRDLISWGHYQPGVAAALSLWGKQNVFLTSLELLSDPESQSEEIQRLGDFLLGDPEGINSVEFRKVNSSDEDGPRPLAGGRTPRSPDVESRLESIYRSSWTSVLDLLDDR